MKGSRANQRSRILELLIAARGEWVPLPNIMECAAQYNARIHVPLPKRLASELIEWRGLTSTPGPDDFIFPNSRGGFLDYENFEARVLGPIRIQLGLPKLNFQILRRTFCNPRCRRTLGNA